MTSLVVASNFSLNESKSRTVNVHVATTRELVGVGIYEPSEAGRLTGIQPQKLRRWLLGHQAAGRAYAPLWTPQIDVDDERLYLGFRDLTEARVVAALIASGVLAQKVRKAIEIARERYGYIRPLSTRRFRTDGKSIFMLTGEDGDDGRLIDLLRDQYAIRRVIEPSFKGLECNSHLVMSHLSKLEMSHRRPFPRGTGIEVMACDGAEDEQTRAGPGGATGL